MKTTKEILTKFDCRPGKLEIDYALLVVIINEARVDALTSACNVVKTYKVGNGGSWFDAAVDREPIIDLIKQCK